MKTKLKSQLEATIDALLEGASEDNMWNEFIHPELAEQMADAAEAVFDAAQKAQEYCKKESDA